MNLHQLRVFSAIVDKGSFRAAAESLFLSQPSVSQHVAALERHYGVRFFERAKRRVTLTPEGKALYSLARDLLQQADAIPDRFHDMQKLRYGSVQIGVTPHAGSSLLPKAIKAFNALFPDVHVSMIVENTLKAIEFLRSGYTELLVLGKDLLTPPDPSFVARALGSDELILILPSGHPWTQRSVSPALLAETNFIHYIEDCPLRSFVNEYMTRYGVQCRRTIEVNTIQPAEDLVAAGVGVTIICRSQVAEDLAVGKIASAKLEGLHDFRWELQALHSKTKGLSYAARELETQIVKSCAEILQKSC